MATKTKAKPKKKSTLKARKMKSVKDAKRSIKSGGGGGFIKNVTSEGITVRILDEPDEWVEYKERYDEKREPRYYPVDDEDEATYTGPNKASTKYLINIYDVDNKEVGPLKIPKTLAQSLFAFYERYGTLLDRDYDLEREGEKKETTYRAFPADARSRNLTKYEAKKVDLLGILEEQLERAKASKSEEDDDDDYDDEDDDDDDDDEPPRRRTKRGTVKSTKKRRRVVEDEDDDDDDDDEDEDDDEPVRRPKKKSSSGKKKPIKKRR